MGTSDEVNMKIRERTEEPAELLARTTGKKNNNN